MLASAEDSNDQATRSDTARCGHLVAPIRNQYPASPDAQPGLAASRETETAAVDSAGIGSTARAMSRVRLPAGALREGEVIRMYVSGVPLSAFRSIVRRVSEDQYNGNVIVQADAYELGPYRFVGGLAVESPRGSGARRSWTGRRTRAACWHVYRDVLTALFYEYPDALVRTPKGRLLKPERIPGSGTPKRRSRTSVRSLL